MAVSAKLQWSDGLKFTVEVAQGRKMELNAVEEMGRAFTPMELFLVALAGCTAMDIQWIMSRQRQQVDKFEVLVIRMVWRKNYCESEAARFQAEVGPYDLESAGGQGVGVPPGPGTVPRRGPLNPPGS